MENRKMTIVGAGLVGCLWAILLRKKGYDVSVFEKRSDIRKQGTDQGRSINLIITSRGLHGLKLAGLMKKALQKAVPVFGRNIHMKNGEVIYQPYGQNDECNFAISRTTLNQFLLDEAENCGAKIQFDCPVDHIDFKNKQIKFLNRELSHHYEILFGTDGAGSSVRKNLIQFQPSIFRETTEWLNADYKELFMPLLADGSSPLDAKALHIWPRGAHMMMALANVDGSFTMTLYMPKKGPVSFESCQTRERVEELFRNDFSDAIPLMPNYGNDFLSNPQGGLGTVRLTSWTLGDSVVLMGDAAHAIVPFFGQGMNSGFEDCTQLLEMIEAGSDWSEVFNQYNLMQRPNGNAIADMAVENWFEMSERVADPKFQFRKKLEALIEKKFPKKFKSRYGMVTYSRIPYSTVQEAGKLQDLILHQISEGLQSVDDLDFELTEKILDEMYLPFLLKNKIQFEKAASFAETMA